MEGLIMQCQMIYESGIWIGNSMSGSGHGALWSSAPNVPGGTGEHQRDDIGAVTVLHKEINIKLIA
jgi:hypothetical protein